MCTHMGQSNQCLEMVLCSKSEKYIEKDGDSIRIFKRCLFPDKFIFVDKNLNIY